MALVELRKRKESEIVYFEDLHSYVLNGKELLSTTRLLSKIGVAPDYSTVDEELLKKSAERGNKVHKDIESWINGVETTATKELTGFIEWLKDSCYTIIDSEYIVYNDVVAGKVDLLLKDNTTGELVIADIKTTSAIHYESIAWQLSIYKALGGEDIKRGLVIHITKDNQVETRDIPFKKDNDIERLFESVRNDTEYQLPSIELNQNEITTINNALHEIALLKAKQEEYEDIIKGFQEKLISAMEDNGVKSIENDYFKITYVAPVVKTSIDTARLKKEKPELAKEYSKESTSKASVRITMKESD